MRLGWLKLIPFPIVLVLFIGMCTPTLAKCGSADDAVVKLVERCPRAVALLGDDIELATFGCACGETSIGGSSGNAHWEIGIGGSRSSGRIEYTALMTNDVWNITSATLDIDGETVDIVRCTGGARPVATPSPSGGLAERPQQGAFFAQTNDDAASAQLSGRVTRSNHPTIHEGAPCIAAVDRAKGSATAKVVVTCGATRLYEGTAAFRLEVHDPLAPTDDAAQIEDTAATAADGTPGLRMSTTGSAGSLTVWEGAPAFEIAIRF